MPIYRCHLLDSADQIVTTRIVDCETDADIRQTADFLVIQGDYAGIEIWDLARPMYRARKIDMPCGLVQLRRSVPDLAHLDPLSNAVQDWLDRAYDVLKRVDQGEGVILRMHQRDLLDPAAKTVAGAEIVRTIDRAVRTSALRTQADRTRSNA